MRRAAGVLWLMMTAGPAWAQRPTVSAGLDRVFQQDSVAPLWLFLRPDATPQQAADLVAAAGGRVRRQSEWLHAVSADLTSGALARLRQSAAFRHVQPVARFRGPVLPPPGPPPFAAPGDARDSAFGPSAMPYRRFDAFGLVDRGYTGAGVRIAVLDTGFETGLPAFQGAMVVAERDFVFNDGVVRNEPGDAAGASRHGTAVWSLLAARVPGVLIGLAPDAEYLLAKTEDVRSETRVEEDNF
ncbi:MAG TPA: S8 family serine peptidase, partial [Gemmatimonadales bacterium]|nr:S8 family serine peptidase [Gemmatimonadales bacterium]